MSETVLSLVQDILSDGDSDDVNSIEETMEAAQAARLLKSTHDAIADEYDLESHKGLRALTGIGDTTRPSHLLIPDGVHSVELFEYDVRDLSGDAAAWKELTFLEPLHFLKQVNHYGNDGANIQTVSDFAGGSFQIRNDIHPTYYTSFDNSYYVCDSFRLVTSSTLVGSRSRVLAQLRPTLVLSDETVIALPPNLMSLLKSEFRNIWFDVYKDGAPVAVVRQAMRQRVRADRIKNVSRNRRPGDLLPDYGRHR